MTGAFPRAAGPCEAWRTMRAHLSILIVVAACNGDGKVRHLPDAAPQPDSPTPIDAAPSPVTLVVTQDGAPMTGIHVYFQAADSSVVADTTTDAPRRRASGIGRRSAASTAAWSAARSTAPSASVASSVPTPTSSIAACPRSRPLIPAPPARIP